MKPELKYDVTNKNFTTAYNFVLKNYPALFHDRLHTVTLRDSSHCVFTSEGVRRGFLGLYVDHGESAEIIIRNGRYSVAEFMETIVHELVHLHQWHSGRHSNMTHDEKEHEANAVSYQVYKRYQESMSNTTLTGVI